MLLSFNHDIGPYGSGAEHAEVKRELLFNQYHIHGKLVLHERSLGEHFYTSHLGLTDKDYINLYDYLQHACLTDYKSTNIPNLVTHDSKIYNYANCQVIEHGAYSCWAYHFHLNHKYNRQIKKAVFYKNGLCYCIDYFDYRGFLSSTITADMHGGKIEYFYSPQGETMMTAHFAKHFPDPVYKIKNYPHLIVGKQELLQYFLNSVCKKYNDEHVPVTFIADRWRNPELLKHLYNIKHPHHLIMYLHCPQVTDTNHPLTSDPDEWQDLIFRQAKKRPSKDNFDALICSTPRQKRDIINRYHLRRKIYPIPVGIQNINGIKHPLSMKDRSPKQITCVTRVAPIEGIPDTIRAFAIAQLKIQDLKLDIYGKMGPLGEKLSKTIKAIKHKYHIKKGALYIHTYTDRVPEVYRKGQLTLVTSKSDGFNVSLLEALSQGCPAVVYNGNYGPKDMIHGGINGYQVNNGDYHKMAKDIVKYFRKPKLMQMMSNNAYRESCKYSPGKVAHEYMKLTRDTQPRGQKY